VTSTSDYKVYYAISDATAISSEATTSFIKKSSAVLDSEVEFDTNQTANRNSLVTVVDSTKGVAIVCLGHSLAPGDMPFDGYIPSQNVCVGPSNTIISTANSTTPIITTAPASALSTWTTDGFVFQCAQSSSIKSTATPTLTEGEHIFYAAATSTFCTGPTNTLSIPPKMTVNVGQTAVKVEISLATPSSPVCPAPSIRSAPR
jgi:hypothetical protein